MHQLQKEQTQQYCTYFLQGWYITSPAERTDNVPIMDREQTMYQACVNIQQKVIRKHDKRSLSPHTQS